MILTGWSLRENAHTLRELASVYVGFPKYKVLDGIARRYKGHDHAFQGL